MSNKLGQQIFRLLLEVLPSVVKAEDLPDPLSGKLKDSDMDLAALACGQLGQDCLEEAVLIILQKARRNGGEGVRAAAIAKAAGIYAKSRRPAYGNAITSGILAKLAEQGRIEQSRDRGPWRLTEAEFAEREASGTLH